MKPFLLFFFLLWIGVSCSAQEERPDTSRTLEEVTIKAFEQNRKASSSVASITILGLLNADRYNKLSLLSGLNTITGVRMEERSPGSYRINIRGSSLRSPFGVRNVKVYWNDIPITDPGGNSYFNQFAWNNFSYIELFKGPAGSMYGAGTGGLILLHTLDPWRPGASLEYITGSYGLHNILGSARFGRGDNKNQFTYAHNQTDGYRVQTRMRRDNFSWQSQLILSAKQQLDASVLFSDMYYQTPGALTLAEFTADPKAARPAGGGFPSAVNAHAGIYQKNITVGFTDRFTISSAFSNKTTLYGAFAQIKNPAIRNYERRNEPGFGGRTVFTFNKKSTVSPGSNFQIDAGSEFQQGYFNTQVSKNKNGNPDTLITNDDINYTAYSFFLQGDWSRNDWFINTGVSLNKTVVSFSRLSNYPVIKQQRSYQGELAPRLSIRKNFTGGFAIKGTVSRGFSPPTVAELLPSTGVISTDLEAEYGWNYETTASHMLFKGKLQLEATGFYFNLNKALVQRRDLSGADYFVNSGNVKQEGIELHAAYRSAFHPGNFIQDLHLSADYTYDHFRYGSFVKGVDDFSGKTVPSVPSNTLSLMADIEFMKGFYSSATYYSASKIFLNDANTAVAKAYHLLGWRLGWKKTIQKRYKLGIYAGADNLLNENYSLGNDINAAANRFYNAAPPRNYYAGLSFQWLGKLTK